MHDLFTIPYLDQAYADNAWAWSQWAAASCIERHGGHPWHLYLLHPEEDSEWGIACDYCGRSAYDEYGDMAEFAEGHIPGVQLYDTLGDPRHDAGREGHVPIKVAPWSRYYSSPNGEEWESGLIIAPLGPIVWEDDCCHPNPEGTT